MEPVASDRLSGLQFVERTWRTVFSAFWRLPLLILGSWIFYALISHSVARLLPEAGRYDFGLRFFYYALYGCLHAAIFAPLVTAMMFLVLRHDARSGDFWTPAILAVAAGLAIREFVDLVLATPTWFWSSYSGRRLAYELYQNGTSLRLIALMRWAPQPLWYLACFLLWTRLILIFPRLALGESWRNALAHGWNAMHGHYKFALAACFVATAPCYVFDRSIYPRLRDAIAPAQDVVIQNGLTWVQAKPLLVQSASLEVHFMVYASLAAWLYRVIRARDAATAPSL